ncbi:FAD-binding domain-containing protein [Colletotrichum somersetense]|nr:FAD-binding domain-containing protein [Colletotrichum somersetense]
MCRLSSIAAFAIVALIPFAHAQDLEACLDSAGLITSFPGTNASFPDDIRSWQRRITPTPAGVAWPRTADEVAAALACAREAKVLVAARDGGHCYGSYSLPNAGLTINMTNFQDVSYDDWLWKTHGARFPHVRANMVGLIGSSIGGGFGSLSRMLGTPMDYLEGATYMLYNGTVVNASRTENPDLFWALQGAGSSYGIILSLTTKTWKPTYQQAINYTITLTDSSPGAGVDALLAIQDHYLAGRWPDELTMRWSLTAPPYTGSGFYWGNPDDFDALLEPLVAKLPDGTSSPALTASSPSGRSWRVRVCPCAALSTIVIPPSPLTNGASGCTVTTTPSSSSSRLYTTPRACSPLTPRAFLSLASSLLLPSTNVDVAIFKASENQELCVIQRENLLRNFPETYN